jgi:hypothetical protein
LKKRPRKQRSTGKISEVNSTSRQEPQLSALRTGETVGKSGIYRVVHTEHRLPDEVTLMDGHIFPSCEKCAASVEFEFLRPVTNPTSRKGSEPFHVVIHALPVLEDEAESEPKAG